MKKKLFELYSSKQEEFQKIKETITDAKVNGPFLMSPNDKYQKQNNKLLVIGQETKGWENFEDLQKQMFIYEDFNLGVDYYSSPFWNVMRKIEKGLKNEEYSSAWTNISKFDVNRKRAVGSHELIISELDYLLKEEIKIITPDTCMFFTSHTFDNRLKKIFEGLEFIEVPTFDRKVLCKLKHNELPENSYRTYHPKFLRISKNEENFIKFIKTI